MRAIWAVALAAVLGGCTTTKVLQRDGCWVRQTKRVLGSTSEELGPCPRQPPQWVPDRLTRLVQECLAQADHRWTTSAIDAWNRRQPLPAQPPEREVIRACMDQTAGSAVTQNETLRERLAEVSSDRAALAARTADTDAHLRASHDRLAESLGEAARRPPPVATATASATSDGSATTDSGLTSQTGTSSQAVPAIAPALAAPAVAPRPEPASPPVLKALQRARARKAPRLEKAIAPACATCAPAEAGPRPAADGDAGR
jgi:hypothetical protein